MSGARVAKNIAMVLGVAWLLMWPIGYTWGAATHFRNGPEPLQTITSAVLALGGAALIVGRFRPWFPSGDRSPVPKPTGPRDGWYRDPSTRHEWRYFDGTDWTAHAADQGVEMIDPIQPVESRPPTPS